MKTFLIVSAFALVLASSCSNFASKEPANAIAEQATPPEAPMTDSIASYAGSPGSPDQEKQEQKPGNNIPAVPPKIEWNKKIIKNANLELEVKDFKSFSNQVSAIAGKYGGYIAEENLQSTDFKLQSRVVIRIPVELFEPTVGDLSTNAERILTKNITSKDVTGEVVDVRSRLEARRQARLRYLELMKQAKNMDEVFQVQKEVDAIQEEMEAASGRIGYLNHAAAYSTIELTYFQILNADLVKEKEKEPSFGDRVLNAFEVGFKWLGELLLVLITLWPMILGAVVLIYFVRKITRNNRAKVAAAPVTESQK
ncbi:MAG: DUF4349 domain-containing protein [Chitinophagaceae bacterium]|nr:DUF4349 domain-containing protein [Chitinophagaceae bacterium]